MTTKASPSCYYRKHADCTTVSCPCECHEIIHLDLVFADETGAMVIATDETGAILEIDVDVVRLREGG